MFYDSSNIINETTNLDHTTVLHVKDVIFYIQSDGIFHHTDDFNIMQDDNLTPIFRRGQSFSITICFNRNFSLKEDYFYLLAEYGPNPAVSKGTKYSIPLTDQGPVSHETWEMWSTGRKTNIIDAQIQAPSNCQVGVWRLSIYAYMKGSKEYSNFCFPQHPYILFNPWNQNDSVFLANEAERQEYVLNENGKIWMGTNKNPIGYPWVFGQFDGVVLSALVKLLDRSEVPHSERGSPVLITRALSAVMNSYDDGGLIVGKWEGEFHDGTKPFAWTGSTTIFEKYLETGRPVKYAQCWVFSGVLTTACRALGIPCRPVTCYVCAHDTNNSLTVDKFYSKNGKLLDGGEDGECYDSIWNFHCWNDVWMARPDLPPGYDGWQAVDATPQEKSDRIFRTGPSSLRAIKEGLVGYLYDTGFLFSEVNADLCHFQQDKSSPWGFTRIKLDSSHIGRRIVTLSIVKNINGEGEMEDISAFYKNAEGSEAERAAVFSALRGHPRAQKYYQAVNQPVVTDVFFKLKDIDVLHAGEDFSIELLFENHAPESRTIKSTLSAHCVQYTGQVCDIIKEKEVKVVLHAKKAHSIALPVTAEEYMNKIGNNSQVKIMAVAHVLETKQTFTAEDDFEIIKGKLDIQIAEQIKVGNVLEANFSFVNPFGESLTNCEITVEGLGLHGQKTSIISNVPPKGQFKHCENCIPKRHGRQVLVATFTCDQLSCVQGSKHVHVQM